MSTFNKPIQISCRLVMKLKSSDVLILSNLEGEREKVRNPNPKLLLFLNIFQYYLKNSKICVLMLE